MHDPERVLEARMSGARPDPRDEPELLDALEPNERGRADQGEIRSAQRNAIVQGVPNGRFDRESSGRSGPWLDHDAKDRPASNASAGPLGAGYARRRGTGAGERGRG